MILVNILLILASILLIVVVLMQEGNKQGLGVIGGAAETFLGKNKAKSYEGKLLTITRILAAVFVVLAIFATWMNARKYTVTYMVDTEDENGNPVTVEYYPYAASMVAYNNMMAQAGTEGYTETTYSSYVSSVISTYGEDTLRSKTTYKKGDSITAYGTPSKEGYTGVWQTKDGKSLPEKMGSTNYTVYANYTVNSYTVNVTVNDVEGNTVGDPFTVTGEYGTAIEYPETIKLPEKMEGYKIAWSSSLPSTIPGSNTDINVVYTAGNYIRYYDENGEEYFPYAKEMANYYAYLDYIYNTTDENREEYYNNMDAHVTEYYDVVYNSAVEAGDMDLIRQFVENGSAIKLYDAPAKEVYTVAWDQEVSETMEGTAYDLHPVYTEAPAAETAAETEAPAEEATAEAAAAEAPAEAAATEAPATPAE